MSVTDLRSQLLRDEGMRLRAYQDSAGVWTIGVGRNLQELEISEELALAWLREDMNAAIDDVRRALPWAVGLDEARQGVLYNLCFNMGLPRLLEFRRMLAALGDGRWYDAATELLDSRYAQQVPERAWRLARQIETGEWQ